MMPFVKGCFIGLAIVGVFALLIAISNREVDTMQVDQARAEITTGFVPRSVHDSNCWWAGKNEARNYAACSCEEAAQRRLNESLAAILQELKAISDSLDKEPGK